MTQRICEFNTDDDMTFYLLNAVCHDFIHDFNNYERMGKIIEYIKMLNTSAPLPSRDAAAYDDQFQHGGEGDGNRLALDDYISSQMDEYLYTEPIEMPPDFKLNDSMLLYNKIKTGKHCYNTRSSSALKASLDATKSSLDATKASLDATKASLDVTCALHNICLIQHSEEYIHMCKLLIISKIFDPTIDYTSVADSPPPVTAAITGGSKQRGGMSGIGVVTITHSMNAIGQIINEIQHTPDIDNKQEIMNVFYMIQYVMQKINIPNSSSLEILANSIVTDVVTAYLISGCNGINIREQADLYLSLFVKQPTIKSYTKSYTKSVNTPQRSRPKCIDKKLGYSNFMLDADCAVSGGGMFTPKIYRELNGTDKFREFETAIYDMKIVQLYKGIETENDIRVLMAEYNHIIVEFEDVIKSIVGTATHNAYTNMIANKMRTIDSQQTTSKRAERTLTTNIQLLKDTLANFVCDKILLTYEDIKQRTECTRRNADNSETALSNADVISVQQISRLVARKTMQLGGLKESDAMNEDLTTQVTIISKVSKGNGYVGVDNALMHYFNNTYKSNPSFISQTEQFITIVNKNQAGLRIINNAAPEPIKSIINATGKVVCPTSSVCDAMGSFGSCLNPSREKQEYYNMNFQLQNADASNFYLGKTQLTHANKSVTINYGLNLNELGLYNELIISLTSSPIVLCANYTFKGVVNRIINIWKMQSTVTNVNALWESLMNTDYFLSILKLGSQKAIGDIFQEINSTVENGGYEDNVQSISNKISMGIMGDRPSGIRVIKLLKDGKEGGKLRSMGGFVGKEMCLLYDNRSQPVVRQNQPVVRQNREPLQVNTKIVQPALKAASKRPLDRDNTQAPSNKRNKMGGNKTRKMRRVKKTKKCKKYLKKTKTKKNK